MPLTTVIDGPAETIEDRLARAEAEIESLRDELRARDEQMAQPHFLQDSAEQVRQLIELYPLEEAMVRFAGDYDRGGRQLTGVLQRCGLADGMALIDLGCGSGRVAKYVGLLHRHVSYLGLDLVQELLDYAATQAPHHFRFLINRSFTLPAADDSIDIVFAFSVFTHLLHEESYAYVEEARRVLRPGGRLVFSFLESAANWPVFGAMVNQVKGTESIPHLTMFIERPQIQIWAEKLGMIVAGYDFGDPHAGLGQTVVMLRKG